MTEIICAGFGGQGILTAGMLLIHAGMKNGQNVIFYPSYGSEMRGGTANCSVKISDKKIASPVIRQADIVFTMNAPAIDKFESMLKPGGLLLVNASLVDENRTYRDDIRVVKAPVTDIANELENPRGANIAMLGVLAASSDLFDPEFLIGQINGYFEGRGRKIPANEACLRKGMEAAK
jgi:2-oxoglutarate ferredoxin oxidoreductase subunit gamma